LDFLQLHLQDLQENLSNLLQQNKFLQSVNERLKVEKQDSAAATSYTLPAFLLMVL
jgi:DNA-directed RNA polymerase specialized sigma54-like protein